MGTVSKSLFALGAILLIAQGGFCQKPQEVWHFKPSDVNALHKKPADHLISYGEDSLQFGELRLPDGPGPHPVAIIVHGGCWISKYDDLQSTGALADALRDQGYATWNIEYRREDNKGGGWPGTFEDVAHATDFLQKIASKYSLDLNRVIAVGHSAGGHLALWLAARHNLPPNSELYMKHPLPLQGVIALGAIPDLKAFRNHGEKICGSDVIGKLLGASLDQVEKHYKEASPIELLPLGIPQIFIYGTKEKSVPISFGKDYIERAQQKGDSVKIIEVENAAHHEYKVPNSVTWPAVKSAIESLLGEGK